MEMAKLMNSKERKARKVMAGIARELLELMEVKEVVTTPHTYALKKALEAVSKADKVKMRRGTVRNREQFLNPRTVRYYVREKGGRILYGGKKSPYKNIRMVKGRRRK